MFLYICPMILKTNALFNIMLLWDKFFQFAHIRKHYVKQLRVLDKINAGGGVLV